MKYASSAIFLYRLSFKKWSVSSSYRESCKYWMESFFVRYSMHFIFLYLLFLYILSNISYIHIHLSLMQRFAPISIPVNETQSQFICEGRIASSSNDCLERNSSTSFSSFSARCILDSIEVVSSFSIAWMTNRSN